jgi:hypothetical protein
MSLRVRAIKLAVRTDVGPYGFQAEFPDGLVLIRANNTHGKSTLLQSMIWALGLESMFGGSSAIPLSHAMTDRLRTPAGDEVAVQESSVLIEIENGDGERLTCQRWVVHPSIQRNLVRTWTSPEITRPSGAGKQRDYYVRQSGAAVGEFGFHRRLAEFVGWRLPDLVTADGRTVPLYLELIFPLLFVEQKRGWAGIQPYMPIYGGLRETRRRAIEFILDLKVYQRIQERDALRARLSDIATRYATLWSGFQGRLHGTGVSVQGIDSTVPTSWPPEVPAALLVAGPEGGWLPVADEIDRLEVEATAMSTRAVPTAGDAAIDSSARLKELEEELSRLSASGASLLESAAMSREELQSVEARLATLEEDRRRYREALVLHRLGSEESLHIVGSHCPTCHQVLPSTLLAESDVQAMSLDDNLAFLGSQVATFEGIKREATRRADAVDQQVAAVRNRVSDVQASIRAERDTLVSASESPSVADVRQQLVVQDRLATLRSMEVDFIGLLEDVAELAELGAAVRRELEQLPPGGLDAEDEARLADLQRSLREQLSKYNFRSFPVEFVEVSRETYHPTREGFDLGFALSASDSIRMVWAYLLGLLEVSRVWATNHPGLLIFDEPRQQSADRESFEALLRRASESREHEEQVIFATSQPSASLQQMLEGAPYILTEVEGMLLAPVD